MKTDRLNAFTDGVLAIVITIMVLELKVPRSDSLASLIPSLPLFGAYALTFLMVGIYWNNHHHMLHVARKVDGRVLWANHFLLFAISLFPFVMHWIGEEGIAPYPVAAYGVVSTLAGIAYLLLERALLAADDQSPVERAVKGLNKELLTLALDIAAVVVALRAPWIAVGIYLVIAAIWLIPDRRFESSKAAVVDESRPAKDQ